MTRSTIPGPLHLTLGTGGTKKGMKIIFAIVLIELFLLASCSSCDNAQNGNSTANSNGPGTSNANRDPLAFATPPPEPVPSSTLDPNFKQCNPFYPLVPGSQARYSLLFSTGLQASPVVVVDKASENSRDVFVQTVQIVDKSGGLNKN